jgi:putative flippase GtrA
MMLLAWLSFVCGLILDTVTRGRWEVKRLQYLSLRTARNRAVEASPFLARLWNAEFIRFGAVGTAAFVVDTSVLYLALWAGLGFYAGRVGSYLAAATFTWYGNRRLTFTTHAHGKPAIIGRMGAVSSWRISPAAAVNYATYAAAITFDAARAVRIRCWAWRPDLSRGSASTSSPASSSCSARHRDSFLAKRRRASGATTATRADRRRRG